MSECIHGVDLSYNCNACSDECYPNRILPDTTTSDERPEVVDGVQKLVDEQAEDDGLWFEATTAPEDYLQRHLRELHAAIEKEPLYTLQQSKDILIKEGWTPPENENESMRD